MASAVSHSARFSLALLLSRSWNSKFNRPARNSLLCAHNIYSTRASFRAVRAFHLCAFVCIYTGSSLLLSGSIFFRFLHYAERTFFSAREVAFEGIKLSLSLLLRLIIYGVRLSVFMNLRAERVRASARFVINAS